VSNRCDVERRGSRCNGLHERLSRAASSVSRLAVFDCESSRHHRRVRRATRPLCFLADPPGHCGDCFPHLLCRSGFRLCRPRHSGHSALVPRHNVSGILSIRVHNHPCPVCVFPSCLSGAHPIALVLGGRCWLVHRLISARDVPAARNLSRVNGLFPCDQHRGVHCCRDYLSSLPQRLAPDPD
jgi:hypothetical protein